MGNEDYSARRLDPGYDGFVNLDAVSTDIENVKKGLVNLGVREEEILVKREADFAVFSKLISQDLAGMVAANWLNGK